MQRSLFPAPWKPNWQWISPFYIQITFYWVFLFFFYPSFRCFSRRTFGMCSKNFLIVFKRPIGRTMETPKAFFLSTVRKVLLPFSSRKKILKHLVISSHSISGLSVPISNLEWRVVHHPVLELFLLDFEFNLPNFLPLNFRPMACLPQFWKNLMHLSGM